MWGWVVWYAFLVWLKDLDDDDDEDDDEKDMFHDMSEKDWTKEQGSSIV